MGIVSAMICRMAMGAVVCFALFAGNAHAATGEPSAPVAAPTASDDTSADSTVAAPEQDDSNPYSSIVRANVFHLAEPPKPAAVSAEQQMSVKVNISGFKKREGEPVRALFATVPKDPKESPKYFDLSEGEKEDILEVKKIDPNQESVDVIISGIPMTLTVKSNSFVQPIIIPKNGAVIANNYNANPGLIAHPPAPGLPGYVQPLQHLPQQQQQQQQGMQQQQQEPSASGRGGVIVAGGGVTPAAASITPGVAAQNSYAPPEQGAGSTAVPGAENSLRSIPTRGIRTTPYPPPGQR